MKTILQKPRSSKRERILNQAGELSGGYPSHLIDKNRALARDETLQIIATIRQRAAANDLNRGLRISLPYFDHQAFEIRQRNFEVIPRGMILFVPAFVVLAVRREMEKVAQDRRLDYSTCNDILDELRMLEEAFQLDGKQ